MSYFRDPSQITRREPLPPGKTFGFRYKPLKANDQGEKPGPG